MRGDTPESRLLKKLILHTVRLDYQENFVEQMRLITWMSEPLNDWLADTTPTPVFRYLSELVDFIDLEDLDLFLETFPSEKFTLVVRLFRILNLNFTRQNYELLLRNPDFVTYLLEHQDLIERETLNESGAVWSKRLQNLRQVLQGLGLHDTLDEDLAQVALRIWQNKAGMAEVEAYNSAAPSHQQTFKSRLVAGLGLQKEQKMRTWIRENWSLSPEIDLNETQLGLIDAREDPVYPLRPYAVSWGYEVEHTNDYLPKLVYKVLGETGINQGKDAGVELAPGPFYAAETGLWLWRLYHNGRLINLHKLYHQTCHLNFGVESAHLSAETMRLVHAMMLIYDPDLDAATEGKNLDHQLQIYNDGYIEAKEGRVEVADDFELGFYLAIAVSITQKAFEQIYSTYRPTWTQERSGFPPDINPNISSSRYEIYPHLTAYSINSAEVETMTKKLALIRLEMMRTFQEGLKSIGLDQLAQLTAPFEQANTFYRHLKKVFPDLKSRYEPDSLKKRVGRKKIVAGEKTYPNLVIFARELATDCAVKVKELFDQEEATTVVGLRQIRDATALPQRQQLMIDYGSRTIFFQLPDEDMEYLEYMVEEHLDWLKLYDHLFDENGQQIEPAMGIPREFR